MSAIFALLSYQWDGQAVSCTNYKTHLYPALPQKVFSYFQFFLCHFLEWQVFVKLKCWDWMDWKALHPFPPNLHRELCTLHTQDWTQIMHTAHCTLISTHCTLSTEINTLHTAHCRLHTEINTLHTVHWTLKSAHCTLHTEHRTLYSAEGTLHTTLWRQHTAHSPPPSTGSYKQGPFIGTSGFWESNKSHKSQARSCSPDSYSCLVLADQEASAAP